jgi:hypothetical protein
MDFTWIKGPTSDTKSTHAPGMDQRAHRAATQWKTTRWGHHRGSADLGIDRIDLGGPILALHMAALYWSFASLPGV